MNIRQQHETMRSSFSGEPNVQVMKGTGGICVIHSPTLHLALWVERMLKIVGQYPYQILPANLRKGYYTVVILKE